MSKRTIDKAKKNKNDEFYTQLVDIEKELRHYKEQFRGKVVFCNCDDPYESNFFKYFAMNFNHLGLKKLIATCYVESPIANQQLSLFDVLGLSVPEKNKIKKSKSGKHPHKIEINEVDDYNKDGAVDLADIEWLLKNKNNTFSLLKGDGDFRSQECIELLKESDIVVTNPPFSLFREYIDQLTTYEKDYVIMGNTNALTYKEVYKLFKEDKIRTGYTNFNVGMYFYVSDDSEKYHKVVDGKKMVRVSTSCWFTSLPVSKHNEFLTLYKRYNKEDYPTYDNFNAINVNTYTDIPCDYDGYMGVPITFLDKYNPKQFKIIGQGQGNLYRELTPKGLSQKFVDDYYKNGGRGSIKEDHPVLAYYDNNGKPVIPYMRIIIKRRTNNEN
jgi:hypothetical protein